MEKTRGKFLTIMLILSFFNLLFQLGVLVLVIATVSVRSIEPTRSLPKVVADPVGTPIAIVEVLLLAAALYGVHRWRKWGAYLIVILSALQFILSLFNPLLAMKGQIAKLDFSVISSAVFLLLWFWALRRKWQYFQ